MLSGTPLVFVGYGGCAPFSLRGWAGPALTAHTPRAGLVCAALASAAPGRLVTVNADGVLGAHKWAARRVVDARAPLSGKGQTPAQPLALDLDGSVSGVAAGRHRLPWPLEESVAPLPALFALLPDGRHVVSGGHWDATVKVTQTETGKAAHTKHVDAPVTSLAVSADGTALVTGCRSGAVLLWELIPRTGRVTDASPTVLIGHDFPVTSVAVSLDLDLVLSLSQAGAVVHAIARSRFVRTIRHPTHASPLLGAISPEGFLLVAYPGQQLGASRADGEAAVLCGP